MMLRTAGVLVCLLLVGLFAAVNWGVFSADTPLWLGFTTVQAPLGIIMLGVVTALSVVFGVWGLSLQLQFLRETRRHSKEIVAQRELADKAEASRFTELKNLLSKEFAQLNDQLEASGNGVAAHLGQLEDRFETARVLPKG
jgi:uncharacterized integral membrane protein